MELAKVDTIIERHGADSTALLAIMQDVQEELRYLPRPAMERVADKLGIPITRVYQMATFFEAFHLEPRGKHICTVCMGTACHVRGAAKLVDQLERDLKVKSGGTTADMMFTVEEVNCVGACALGPLVIVDGEYHGNMTTNSLSKVITSMKGDGQGGE